MEPSTHEVCQTVLDMALDKLAALGRPVSRAYVAAGQMTWDDCCGTLGVLPERVFRSEVFPLEASYRPGCDASITVYSLVVFLLRCVDTVSAQGVAPTVDVLDPQYHAFLDDADAMLDLVTGPMPDGWLATGASQIFTGDEGGCIAVQTSVTVGIDLW